MTGNPVQIVIKAMKQVGQSVSSGFRSWLNAFLVGLPKLKEGAMVSPLERLISINTVWCLFFSKPEENVIPSRVIDN